MVLLVCFIWIPRLLCILNLLIYLYLHEQEVFYQEVMLFSIWVILGIILLTVMFLISFFSPHVLIDAMEQSMSPSINATNKA